MLLYNFPPPHLNARLLTIHSLRHSPQSCPPAQVISVLHKSRISRFREHDQATSTLIEIAQARGLDSHSSSFTPHPAKPPNGTLTLVTIMPSAASSPRPQGWTITHESFVRRQVRNGEDLKGILILLETEFPRLGVEKSWLASYLRQSK